VWLLAADIDGGCRGHDRVQQPQNCREQLFHELARVNCHTSADTWLGTPGSPSAQVVHAGEDLALMLGWQLDRRVPDLAVLTHGGLDGLPVHGVPQPAQDRQHVRQRGAAGEEISQGRAVLEHIPGRQRALERMISAVRPGGWLVLEAIDFGGVMAAAMAHYADPPEHAPLYERTVRAIEAAFAAAGGDANFGARLVRTLTDAGLVNIAAEARTPLVAGGTENWIPGTVEHLAEHMVSTGLVTVSDIESVLAMTGDRSCHYAPSPMVTAWGQRPG